MLKNFWNSKWLGWAAVKFSRFLNYVYVLLGIILLVWGVQGAGGVWVVLGLAFAVSGILSIRSIKKRKHERTHTACPSCAKEVKIGLEFCPECGTELPVHEVPLDGLDDAGQEEAAYNT